MLKFFDTVSVVGRVIKLPLRMNIGMVLLMVLLSKITLLTDIFTECMVSTFTLQNILETSVRKL